MEISYVSDPTFLVIVITQLYTRVLRGTQSGRVAWYCGQGHRHATHAVRVEATAG